jgi:hypothetical protein
MTEQLKPGEWIDEMAEVPPDAWPQPVALLLAEKLEQQFPVGTAQRYLDGEAAAELRRLHARVQELESGPRIECPRCGRILADVPPAGDTFAERWRNVTGAIKDLL